MANLFPAEQRRTLVTDIGGTITGDREYLDIQDEIKKLRNKMAEVQDVAILVYSADLYLIIIPERAGMSTAAKFS